MIFEDRLSAYPNRFRATDADGRESLLTLERADEPIREGTPLNAETLNSMQEEIQIVSEDYPGCCYRMVGGEQEWINPPMMLETEYRTTERFNGKPVYVFVINYNDMSEVVGSSRMKYYDYVSPRTIVGISAVIYDAYGNSYPYPALYSDETGDEVGVSLSIETTYGLQAGLDPLISHFTSGSAIVTVKYTK